ncbi:MAG: hypothetical protein MUC48_04785 [Leptolyngbya sp. Prado105]|jgi:hypothetical protein|nr:hypothetical protein [Leptolyngbya sp. Prado105]
MKKIVSLMMSVIVLTFGGVRSSQAQGLLNFNPTLAKSDLKEDQDKPSPSQSLPTPQPSSKGQPPSKGQPQVSASPAIFTTAILDQAQAIAPPTTASPKQLIDTSSDDDRLVAIAPDELFEGGPDSLVAKAVGSAEGTRTPDGGKTWAYYGHVDPGNGVWNMGSFSYQHGADSPDDADRKQLDRLRRQYNMIQDSAIAAGLRLGLAEQLNGIDLANQAPLAALDQGGYIDRLRQAYDRGLQGSEAVLQARTYSYLNPRTNQWEAPGLGNTEESISRDQARRQSAIAEAISSHQQSQIARSRSQTDVKVSSVPD